MKRVSKPAVSETSWLPAILLAMAAFLVYVPILNGGFLWDDNITVTENSLLRSAAGLWRIWFSTDATDYFPLTYTMFWLQWHAWGANPMGYHVVNVLLHAASVVVLWRVLVHLKLRGAWLAALVFCMHPICVATVAWISELKNTLSLLLFLLALLCYLRFEEEEVSSAQPNRRASYWYVLSLVAFVCALLSKTSVVVLPVVLLFLIYWRRSWKGRDLLLTTPFFLFSVAFGLVTIWFQQHHAIEGVQVQKESLLARLAEAGWAVWFYFGKILLPWKLTVIYPRWELLHVTVLSLVPFALLIALFILFWRFRSSWGRPWFVAMGIYIASLLPVLGFVDMSFLTHSRVADHWEYLPMLAVIVLGVCGAWSFVGTPAKGKFGLKKDSARSVAVVLVLALAVLSVRRATIYASEEKLWRDTITKNGRAWAAHVNLGRWLGERGQLVESEEECALAVALYPASPMNHYNLGNALYFQQKIPQAIEQYTEALRLDPRDARASGNLAGALAAAGRLDEAISQYRAALKLDPENGVSHYNLALLLDRKERGDEAIPEYRETIRLVPTQAEAFSNLGRLLAQRGHFDEAVLLSEQALAINPNSVQMQFNLAAAYEQKGDWANAAKRYGYVLEMQPNNPVARQKMEEASARVR